MNKNIIITESQFNILLEVDFNYHRGNLDLKNVEPYGSDTKYMMRGRDTGHFGSGLYFSTYNCGERRSNVDQKEQETDKTPELVQIKDGVYRVDMDLYKNLYKVSSERQGDVLFYSLKEINGMYYIMDDYINHGYELPKDFSERYLIVKNNFNTIGLKIPQYREFITMIKEHIKSNKPQSMSTLIMEYNGYNGVNVSGIYKYDNTTHGSVIYDISKISNDIRKINVSNFCGLEKGIDDKKVSGSPFDFKTKLLLGKDVINAYPEEFKELTQEEQAVAIKKYKYWLNEDVINELLPNIKNIYFNSLSYKIKNNLLPMPNEYNLMSIINNGYLNIIYDLNNKIKNKTLLLYVLEKCSSNVADKLIQNINRKLTPEEQEEIDWQKSL